MQLRDDDGTCKYGNGSAFGRQRSARISEQASSDRRSAGGCAKDGNPAPAAIPDRERKPCSRHGDRRPQPQNVGSLPCHSPGSAEYGQRADHWSERNRERASGARHTRAQQARRETILESELFGHEKGAFTGADSSRAGLFEATSGGTLFLDEISETSLSFQVKLLRVLQEQQVRRLGSNTFTSVDVRIVAATNKNLNSLIPSGQFREDLYYRISVITIDLPSLEERLEDIPLLAEHFLAQFNQRNQRQVTISEGAVRRLTSLRWPGNVRELENLIERLAIFTATGQITAQEVERERAERAGAARGSENPASTLGGKLEEIERQEILRVLREAKGNKSLAARMLGIERKTLYEKARRLAIDLQSRPS